MPKTTTTTLRCPECGSPLTVVPGSEGRIWRPLLTASMIRGRPLKRRLEVGRFVSCPACEFCARV